MNPDLLDLDLPTGVVPDLPDRVPTPEETDRWQAENRRLRRLRGDAAAGFEPAGEPFTMEDWPLAPHGPGDRHALR